MLYILSVLLVLTIVTATVGAASTVTKPVLTTDKNTYVKGEAIKFTLTNNYAYAITLNVNTFVVDSKNGDFVWHPFIGNSGCEITIPAHGKYTVVWNQGPPARKSVPPYSTWTKYYDSNMIVLPGTYKATWYGFETKDFTITKARK
jgi:hypothetical protein